MTVENGDLVLVPKGHHPCGAPYGYDMYYLNVMAAPLRKWRFENRPNMTGSRSATPRPRDATMTDTAAVRPGQLRGSPSS